MVTAQKSGRCDLRVNEHKATMVNPGPNFAFLDVSTPRGSELGGCRGSGAGGGEPRKKTRGELRRHMLRPPFDAVATSREGHRLPGRLWSKAEKPKRTSFALPLKADKSPHQHGECSNRSTLPKKSKEEERKGSRGGNCLKGWTLAVPRCSGGFSFRTFLDRWAASAGRYEGCNRRNGTAFCALWRRTVGIVGGADHERKLKGGKKCNEPAAGP